MGGARESRSLIQLRSHGHRWDDSRVAMVPVSFLVSDRGRNRKGFGSPPRGRERGGKITQRIENQPVGVLIPPEGSRPARRSSDLGRSSEPKRNRAERFSFSHRDNFGGRWGGIKFVTFESKNRSERREESGASPAATLGKGKRGMERKAAGFSSTIRK